MLLESIQGHDFKMVYFNSDGRQSTMCGNGGRCIIQFAHDQKIIGDKTLFLAIDGPHHGKINENGSVSLQMIDVNGYEKDSDNFILQTGSPHYVIFSEETRTLNIVEEARKVRYNERFKEFGINVNFVQPISENEIYVRTYERGVEDETLSCGTGVVAASLAYALKNDFKSGKINVETKGGNLQVEYTRNGDNFTNVWLNGGAVKVFEGSVEV
jgi:diaminopimelate epimerase